MLGGALFSNATCAPLWITALLLLLLLLLLQVPHVRPVALGGGLRRVLPTVGPRGPRLCHVSLRCGAVVHRATGGWRWEGRG